MGKIQTTEVNTNIRYNVLYITAENCNMFLEYKGVL